MFLVVVEAVENPPRVFHALDATLGHQLVLRLAVPFGSILY